MQAGQEVTASAVGRHRSARSGWTPGQAGASPPPGFDPAAEGGIGAAPVRARRGQVASGSSPVPGRRPPMSVRSGSTARHVRRVIR